MQVSEPGAQTQDPPVHVSEMEHRLPHRPQLWELLMYVIVSTQLPWHHSWVTLQLAGPMGGLVPGVGAGELFGMMQPANANSSVRLKIEIQIARLSM